MVKNLIPGPFRKIFLRRNGLFEYISPGLLIIFFISIISLDIAGMFILLIAGFIQDWANDEELFSYIRKLF